MGFHLVFNRLKIKKILQTDWSNTFSPTTWDPVFVDVRFFAESQRPLWWIIQHPKNHTLMNLLSFFFFFFRIHISDLFQIIFGWTWLNQQPFPEILAICYFRALWASQACLTTIKKNLMIKLQLLWISYHMQKANFLPQIFLEII